MRGFDEATRASLPTVTLKNAVPDKKSINLIAKYDLHSIRYLQLDETYFYHTNVKGIPMDIEKIRFIKNVENRISPNGVGEIYTSSKKLLKLPKFMQNLIIEKATKSNKTMGFVVEPYSLFLAFEITEDMVSEYLPDDYELVASSLFEDSKPKYMGIIGCFNVHTDVFWGSRFELYVIARNKKTNLMSWLICDYESNTISYDSGSGFKAPTLEIAVLTTSYDGLIICDVQNKSGDTRIDLVAKMEKAQPVSLNQLLWIEGNLSIDYSGELGKKGKAPFGLIFDPREMQYAQRLPQSSIQVNTISFGFIKPGMKPYDACCFPYAQHYLTTVFPAGHCMKNEKDLLEAVKKVTAE